MQLIVNGNTHKTKVAATIAELLIELGMNPQLVAVELNKQLVTRKYHAQTTLNDGDVLEIVTLVGGG